MKSVGVGIIGFGTVGTGVAKILLGRQEELTRRLGVRPTLAAVVDIDTERPRPVELPKGILTNDLGPVLSDKSIQVVIELIGGTTVARDVIVKALEAGKHVVTANKALLARRGREIFDTALKHGVTVSFEASCAGGIPVIKALREGYVGNRITSIVGIVNGTCNYILTKMTKEGIEFKKALKEAQAKGYAEADPTLDLSGEDSAHKLAILARVGFGADFDYEAIFCEGISDLSVRDIRYADELKYTVKLLAIAKDTSEGVELRVHPTLVGRSSELAHVDGAFNAVEIVGDAVGTTMLYGQGAGMMPTASAVVADVADAALGRSRVTFETMAKRLIEGPAARIKEIAQVSASYYLRFMVFDKPGVLGRIAGVLGAHDISIRSVVQTETGHIVPVIIMTHEAKEKNLQEALAEIDSLDVVKAKTVRLRVES